MEEEDDCQSPIVDEKLSIETKLDVSASTELEMKKSVPKDSSVDLQVLTSRSMELFNRMDLDKERNEGSSLDQQAPATESIPEVDNEDNWLSYLDCDAIFDVTCENLSYYNSTKAEKGSDSDLDDTLTFDDAEDCETLARDEGSSNDSCCQQIVDDFERLPNRNFVVSSKISSMEIKIDRPAASENAALTEDEITESEMIKESSNDGDKENYNENLRDESKNLDDDKIEKEEQLLSDTYDFSSDSDDEQERKLIYSSPTVNISAYFKFRDNLKDSKLEAALNRLDPKMLRDKEPLTLEEVEETSTKERTDESETEKSLIEPAEEKGPKYVESRSPEGYLEELARITESSCPKTEEQVQERLKRIAEGKAEIEKWKNDALKDLSVEFEEVEKLLLEQKALKKNQSTEEFDSESEEFLKTDIEMPLTKDQIAESFKSKTEEEDKRRTEMLQECIQVIPRDEDTEQSVEESFDDEVRTKKSETLSTNDDSKAVETIVGGIVQDIILDTEDSLFWRFGTDQEERTYIKGKVYEFDEKKHGARMTEDFLKKHCKLTKLYQTPYLNDVLYLHFKGFSFIENLEKYTGLKCLYLENNGIREIANLENQSELKSLYLHNNLISKIENLHYQTKLNTLNLSHNTIRRIENLDSLKFLNTLNLSHNYIQDTADIEHLRLLDSLSVLDISHNRIKSNQVVNILGDMKELRVICLTGNPVLKLIKLYRKTMILKCKNLRYLDDRPVFPRDRACAEAWMRGGPSEEDAERKRWIEAEQKKINDSVRALINKRKLYKPVGTSEKEAEDKKKTAEDEEEVAATSKLVCTSNELLKLEKKKKSAVSSPCGSSASSSDEEVENDGFGEKVIEKSDGNRPMAEEERNPTVEDTADLLLPWKIQTSRSKKSVKLVEELTEANEYVAGDAERKRFGKEILDERRSIDNPPRELAHYEKLVPETSNETELTARCSKEERKSFESTSISCDITCPMKIENQTVCKDIIENYRRKDERYPFGGQLSSIRQDMKGFCADMDKFVQDNKIVFENGDVKGFWGEKEVKESQGDEETESSVKEENVRWWNTKERKLKVQKILEEREEKAKKIEIVEENDKKEEIKGVSPSDSVYDLLNLRTCSEILLKDVQTYPKNEESESSESTEKSEESSSSAVCFLCNELNSKNRTNGKLKISKADSHCELPAIEESEETIEDTVQRNKLKKLHEKEPVDGVLINLTDSESDNESVVTVIDLYDESAKGSECLLPKLKDSAVNVNALKEGKSKCFLRVSEGVKMENDNTETHRSKVEDSSNAITSNHSLKPHKRIGDCDNADVAVKKSHLIEEIDSERDLNNRKVDHEVVERCRRHMMKEAKTFMKKKSPLIDKYVENFIINKKSQGNVISRNYEQMDFLDLTCAKTIFQKSFDDSEKSQRKLKESSNVKEVEDKSKFYKSNVESIADLLKDSENFEKHEIKRSMDLYKDFCEHLEQKNSERTLLIEPDFMKSEKIDAEEKKCEVLSSMETEQSKEEQTKPLIEVIANDPRNLEDLEQAEDRSSVDSEAFTMDPALRDKILKSINAPKSEEQIERGRRSADKLMKISREAMAKGKPMLDQPSSSCIQQLEPDESRIFFKHLLNDDSSKNLKQNVNIKAEECNELSSNDDTSQKKNDKIKKSLELQVVQEN
nr:dynein assembly factor 1, axonemal homolog [Osmia lignaria]